MEHGSHGYGLGDGVYADVGAGELQDEGQALVEVLFTKMAEVQVHVAVLGIAVAQALLQLSNDSAGDNVPGAHLHAVGDVLFQEALAAGIDQVSAFTAGGFRDEDAGVWEACGVELDELHVLQRRTGAVGQRHSVAGADGAIGGEGEDSTAAAGGEDDGLGRDEMELACADFKGNDTPGFAIVDDYGGDEPFVVTLDGGVLEGGLKKGVQHVEARLIGGEDGALDTHAAEGANGDVAVRVAAPGAAPVLHLDDLGGGVLNEELDGILVGEVVRAADGVGGVQFKVVVITKDGGCAAFGGDGVTADGVDLGYDGDVEGLAGGIGGVGRFNGGSEAGCATADNQDVVL